MRTVTVAVGGLLSGNTHQLLVQLFGLLLVTAYSGIMTFGILKAISLVVPLRITDRELEAGDRLIFNKEVFELRHPIPPPEPIDALGGGRPRGCVGARIGLADSADRRSTRSQLSELRQDLGQNLDRP